MRDNKQKCAIYCRVGLKDDASIESQKQSLLKYAQEMGYTETAAYLDNGYSGNDPQRPAYKQLNTDICAGKIGAVLLADPARIWRNMDGCNGWLDLMDKKSVTVLCRNAPGFQRDMQEGNSGFSKLFRRKKRKQERHTVRTPPPKTR